MGKAPKKAGSPPKRKRARKRAAELKVQGPERGDPDLGLSAPLDPKQTRHGGLLVPSEMSRRAGPEVLDQLWALIEERKSADPEISHSASLLARGTRHVAQKLGEKAVHCVIEAIVGSREGLTVESADVLFYLLVAWKSAGIRPKEVWLELHRRERASHLGEAVGRKRVAIKHVVGRARARVGTAKIP